MLILRAAMLKHQIHVRVGTKAYENFPQALLICYQRHFLFFFLAERLKIPFCVLESSER